MLRFYSPVCELEAVYKLSTNIFSSTLTASEFHSPSSDLCYYSVHLNGCAAHLYLTHRELVCFFLACPVEPTRCGAAHSKYCGKREHQCEEDVVYLKIETKPFTQNAYLLHFLEGHLSSLHSCLTQESPKPCQINVSSTFKKTCSLITRLRNMHINSVNMNLAII